MYNHRHEIETIQYLVQLPFQQFYKALYNLNLIKIKTFSKRFEFSSLLNKFSVKTLDQINGLEIPSYVFNHDSERCNNMRYTKFNIEKE